LKKISKNTMLLGGAVALGVLCFFGADYYLRSYLSSAESRLAGAYTTRKVMVASVEIPAGGTLSSDNLATRSIPQRYLASTALGPDDLDMVEGQKIMVALKPGDPVDRGALERSDSASLSTTVAKGERAITFPVDEISSISGMLVPGDIIDLMYTGTVIKTVRAPEGSPTPTTTKEAAQVRLILQAVAVMATGKTTQKRVVRTEGGGQHEVDMDFTTVTLKVSPTQAQQVLIAQKLGALTAVLRNPDDKTVLEKLVLDEASFRQTDPSAPSARKGGGRAQSYIDMIIGGNGQPGGMRLRTSVGAAALSGAAMPQTGINPEAAAAIAAIAAAAPPAATAAPASPPPAGGSDVRSRLGIATPARHL
jgi:pilus assembly protein CpaB